MIFLKEQNVKEYIFLKEQQLEEWPCPNFVMFLVKFNKRGIFKQQTTFCQSGLFLGLKCVLQLLKSPIRIKN